jgi:hypothetical protein
MKLKQWYKFKVSDSVQYRIFLKEFKNDLIHKIAGIKIPLDNTRSIDLIFHEVGKEDLGKHINTPNLDGETKTRLFHFIFESGQTKWLV